MSSLDRAERVTGAFSVRQERCRAIVPGPSEAQLSSAEQAPVGEITHQDRLKSPRSGYSGHRWRCRPGLCRRSEGRPKARWVGPEWSIGRRRMTRKPLWPHIGWKFVAAAGGGGDHRADLHLQLPAVDQPALPGILRLAEPVRAGGRRAGVDRLPGRRAVRVAPGHASTTSRPSRPRTSTGAIRQEGSGGGHHLHVRVPRHAASRSSSSSRPCVSAIDDYLWSLGSYLVIGSLLTLLGFAVYLIRPDRPGARAMLVASAIWGLYLVTSADMIGPAWFQPLYLMLRAIAPVALVHLALSFPGAAPAPAPPPVAAAGAVPGRAASSALADNLVFDRSLHAFVALEPLSRRRR